ncbi:MAG: FtsX-like permease family protein [Bacteroidales bacterium]
MNTSLFIARQMGKTYKGKNFTGLIKFISILSIALGLAVMIVAMAVVTGFQGEIREKVIGFGSHIQITNFDYNISFETRPMEAEQDFLPELNHIPEIRHVQTFATKPGIIKTEEDIHGIILKGVGPEFNWSFFREKMQEGNVIEFQDSLRSNEVIISRFIARRLQLHTHDDVIVYFIQDPPRLRRFTVAGIYETGLEELDQTFILGDIRHIQRLNNWEENQIGGIEIQVADFEDIQDVAGQINEFIPYHLQARSIRDIYPQLFDWLALLDMNVYVILVLMVLVAGINMITTLLISVLEKTNLIGILKALGGSNHFVRKVFLYNAGFLIARGLFWGNLVGLVFCFLQGSFGLIKLPQDSYYVSEVPINIELMHVVLLNAGTFLICMGMLVLPSYIITRISPVKAIGFR